MLKPKTPQKWFRVTIRGLLILILLAAVALSFMLYRAQVRANVVSELRLGGAIVDIHSYVPWPLNCLGDFEWGPVFEYPRSVAIVCRVDDDGAIKVGDEQLDFESTMVRMRELFDVANKYSTTPVRFIACRGSGHQELETRLLDAGEKEFGVGETEHRTFYLQRWHYQRDWEKNRRNKTSPKAG